jgi:hypothetical protein
VAFKSDVLDQKGDARFGAAGFSRRNASTQRGSERAVDQKETLRSAGPHIRPHLAWRLCNERSAYLNWERVRGLLEADERERRHGCGWMTPLPSRAVRGARDYKRSRQASINALRGRPEAYPT